MQKLYCLLCTLFFFVLFAKGQDAVVVTDQLIADIFEQYTAENETEMDYDTFYDELMFFAQNKINLNKTTKEQLDRLPFLSDSQVENILTHIFRFGPLHSIYELQLIDGLDMTDIRRLLPFIEVGEGVNATSKIFMRDLFKYGKNELLFRIDHGLESKEGYRFLPEEDQMNVSQNANKYVGNALYHSLKYRFHYKDRVQIGFTGEKDAGEQFIGKTHSGYDFYSVSAQFNNFGIFKTIVLGDFRANFGMGLVLRPEFGIGKSSYVLNVYPRNSGLKKYSSTDETNFFRGFGATARIKKFEISAFYSNKFFDADTIGGEFTSMNRTGMHRTLSELAKKHTVNQQVIGGNVTYSFSKIQIGFTAVNTKFNSNLKPDKSVYNYFYFNGNEQTTAGLHYRARLYKLNVFGETGIANNGALATINGFSFSPSSQVSLVALHRFYSPEYDTFYATAFSETSRINNETGFYLGAEIRPYKRWRISAYADSYRFPWAKYGVDAPSIGTDYLLQADYAAQRNVTMFWRFKFEEKQRNVSQTTTVLPLIAPIKKASLRYNLTYNFGNFSFKNVIEGNLARVAESDWTYGLIASQDVSYTFKTIPLKLDFRYQFFDALNYENRLYSYEKDVLYAFSIPMYYGLGNRYYLNLKYELNNKLSLWFKVAQTVYADDREVISSGQETIDGKRKTDFRFLLKWDF